mmetsp:Transcript_69619/g.157379  ORF Transcript_69619/g.157379 Transcript_69619/m.157379 type:complete len:229 (+) Transcript_69619:68-754(+)
MHAHMNFEQKDDRRSMVSRAEQRGQFRTTLFLVVSLKLMAPCLSRVFASSLFLIYKHEVFSRFFFYPTRFSGLNFLTSLFFRNPRGFTSPWWANAMGLEGLNATRSTSSFSAFVLAALVHLLVEGGHFGEQVVDHLGDLGLLKLLGVPAAPRLARLENATHVVETHVAEARDGEAPLFHQLFELDRLGMGVKLAQDRSRELPPLRGLCRKPRLVERRATERGPLGRRR